MKKVRSMHVAAWRRSDFQVLGIILLFFVIPVQFFLAGCSSPPLPPLPPAPAEKKDQTNQGLSPEQLKMLEVEAGDYRLGAGDKIQVYATDVAEINRTYVVGPDGKITLPGIGVLSLDGLTREQAADKLEELLKGIYINPRINIIV